MSNSDIDNQNSNGRIRRRLAAIMAADVAGYSRLMGEDEEGTTRMLVEHRKVMDALIGKYEGRIANTAGDSVIAEFQSSVEAVRCAIDIQESLRTREGDVPEDRRVVFRIGINVGDVITKDGDLLGDGVNVAARLEALAEPGGVCISGEVYDQIEGTLTLECISMGSKRLKNIRRPVRAYRVSDQVAHAGSLNAGSPRRKKLVLTTVLLALTAISGGVIWVLTAPDTIEKLGFGAGSTPASDDSASGRTREEILGGHEVVAEVEWGGHTYLAVLTWGGLWPQADAAARELGGYLVSINSEAENEFVFDLIKDEDRLWKRLSDGQLVGPWIGLYQPDGSKEPDGGWKLSSGEYVSFLNWSEDQPNNGRGVADVGRFHNYVYMPAPFWDDALSTEGGPGYIVELE